MNANLQKQAQELLLAAKQEGIHAFAVGAAIVGDNQLLVLIRAAHESFLPGYAEMPGGGVEEGESLFDALYRETKEETGLDIANVLAFAGGFDYRNGTGELVRQFNVLVKPTSFSIVLNPEEHSQFLWYPTERTDALLLTPKMEQSLEDCLTQLRIGRTS